MSESLSYEELVDHIVSNKPIPNMIEVPDIILNESERTKSEMKARLKPWEVTKTVADTAMVEKTIHQQPTIEFSGELKTLAMSQSVESLSKYYAREAELDTAFEK
ncbi:YJR012C [Zygosaccharomyces parabailii]|nr:YJR012C [Zygosaccharomyces parabailii]CDH15480.1 uncharacterized protein ZBAI_07267 [Zygosaccharomyces bailii ISA1307]